jgi:hypothetical protein
VATLDDDFGFVAASVDRAVQQQRSACDVVLRDPSTSGHALAQHLALAYDSIGQRVESRRASYNRVLDDPMRLDAIVEMRQLLWDVRELQSNLEWLDAAQKSPLDLGTRYFVEDIARAIVARHMELTIVSGVKASYATSSDPWEPLIKAWGSGIPSKEPTVVVVFLPRREEASALLHPLIVHELGHAADERHNLVTAIWSKAQKRVRMSKRFKEAVQQFATSGETDVKEARDHVAARLRCWIAEMLCDSIAVHHLGPSYLYSFLTEVVAGNIDKPGLKHPTPRQRVRHMTVALSSMNWDPIMRAGDQKLYAWIGQQCEQRPSHGPIEEFLSWAIDDLAAVIRHATRRLLKKRVFLPDPNEIGEAQTLLEAGIPPAQRLTGESIARETVLLACWHAALISNGTGPEALPCAPDTPELAKLLPAALELSALTHAWSPAP